MSLRRLFMRRSERAKLERERGEELMRRGYEIAQRMNGGQPIRLGKLTDDGWEPTPEGADFLQAWIGNQ